MDPWNDSSERLTSTSNDTDPLNQEKSQNKRNRVVKLLLVLLLACAVALLGFVLFLSVYVPRSDRSSPEQHVEDSGTLYTCHINDKHLDIFLLPKSIT